MPRKGSGWPARLDVDRRNAALDAPSQVMTAGDLGLIVQAQSRSWMISDVPALPFS